MSEVKPALSPEEWSRLRAGKRVVYGDGYKVADAEIYEDGVTLGATCCGCGIEQEANHFVAALALHGQPFGFTWEDVDLLRSIANAAESDHDKSGEFADWERQRQAESLADRIASLLPPRETPA